MCKWRILLWQQLLYQKWGDIKKKKTWIMNVLKLQDLKTYGMWCGFFQHPTDLIPLGVCAGHQQHTERVWLGANVFVQEVLTGDGQLHLGDTLGCHVGLSTSCRNRFTGRHWLLVRNWGEKVDKKVDIQYWVSRQDNPHSACVGRGGWGVEGAVIKKGSFLNRKANYWPVYESAEIN